MDKKLATHIKGVDTSHWEQTFDFIKGVKDGIIFMMTKASEGLGLDKTCATLCTKAKAAGIKYKGIYHFFHANVSVEGQVNDYMTQYNALKTEMPPILDFEETSVNGVAIKQVVESALEWLQRAAQLSGKVPMLYIDMNMLNVTGIKTDPRFQKFPLWVAKYSEVGPPVAWEFWQFTDKGEQGADTDWFNGNESDLRKFLGMPA